LLLLTTIRKKFSEVTRKALVKEAALPIEAAAREFDSVAVDGHSENRKLHAVLAEQTPCVARLENIELTSERVMHWFEAIRRRIAMRSM
jgi:hypothetical protein